MREFVATFLRVRFPTVLLLNKADVGPAADKNIMKVMRRTDSDQCVVGSALAEVFLKGLRKQVCAPSLWCWPRLHSNPQNQVYYPPGAVEVRLAVDFEADERTRRGLVDVDAKTASRIEKLQDMVFFRFGSTGVWDAVQRAADLCGPVVAYPVSSLSTFRASVDDEVRPSSQYAFARWCSHYPVPAMRGRVCSAPPFWSLQAPRCDHWPPV